MLRRSVKSVRFCERLLLSARLSPRLNEACCAIFNSHDAVMIGGMMSALQVTCAHM